MNDETMGKVLQFRLRNPQPANGAQAHAMPKTSPVTGVIARISNGLPVLYLRLSRQLTTAERKFTDAHVRKVILRWHTYQLEGKLTWHHLGTARPMGRIELGDTAKASLASWLVKTRLPSGPGIDCHHPPIAKIVLVKSNGSVKSFLNPEAWTPIPRRAQGAP
jgi:hypothetical protein